MPHRHIAKADNENNILGRILLSSIDISILNTNTRKPFIKVNIIK